jgi:hypothetical protein
MESVTSIKWRTERMQGRKILLDYGIKWRNVRMQVIIC